MRKRRNVKVKVAHSATSRLRIPYPFREKKPFQLVLDGVALLLLRGRAGPMQPLLSPTWPDQIVQHLLCGLQLFDDGTLDKLHGQVPLLLVVDRTILQRVELNHSQHFRCLSMTINAQRSLLRVNFKLITLSSHRCFFMASSITAAFSWSKISSWSFEFLALSTRRRNSSLSVSQAHSTLRRGNCWSAHCFSRMSTVVLNVPWRKGHNSHVKFALISELRRPRSTRRITLSSWKVQILKDVSSHLLPKFLHQRFLPLFGRDET